MEIVIHPQAKASLDAKALVVAAQVKKEIPRLPYPSPLPDFPVVVVISAKDIRNLESTIVLPNGTETQRHFHINSEIFGLSGEGHEDFIKLCEQFQSTKGIRNVVGAGTITPTAFDWIRQNIPKIMLLHLQIMFLKNYRLLLRSTILCYLLLGLKLLPN